MTKRKDPSQLQHIKGGDWTPDADEILVSNYGRWLPQNVANKINSRLGTRFTGKAVRGRATALGIDAASCQGLLTLTEAARQVGTDQSNLRKYIVKHGLETDGKGFFCYLTEKTWQIIKDRFPPLPEECISTAEAARRLNYHQTTLTWQARKQRIPAYKRGDAWMIPVAEVERLERIQQGATIIGDLSPELGKKRR